MSGHRIEKVNELLMHEIAKLINELIADKSVFITLTRVETTANLASAKVYFSVFPEGGEDKAKKLLSDRLNSIQRALNKRLYMKHVPRIIFVFNEHTTAATEVEKLLDKISSKMRDHDE